MDVRDRSNLSIDESIVGPAIIEESESTFVIPPGGRCLVAGDRSLVMAIDR